MKKIISFILTLCIILSSISFLSIFVQAYSTGDLNNDRKVSAADANMLSQIIVGGDSTALANKMGDVNGDTKVNSTDLNLIKKYFVGKYSIGGIDYKVEEINIDGIDISEYAIELTDSSDACMTYAAQCLKQHIGDACGIYPEIVTDTDGSPTIKLLKDTTSVNGEAGILDDEAYHIYSSDNGITIEGGRYNGCLNGVYDFLKNYIGYRFYYSPDLTVNTSEDNAYRYLYESDKVTLSNVDDTHYPAFHLRNAYSTISRKSPALHIQSEADINSNRKFGIFGIVNKACHGIQNFYSEAEMNNSNWGYKYNRQPCYSNEKFITTVIERVLNNLDMQYNSGRIPGYNLTNVDIAQIDGFADSFCSCRLCAKALREEGCHTGAYLRFANRVDDAIQARPEYKGKVYTSILVYTATSSVPNVTKPNDTLFLSFCFYIDGYMICANHSIGDKTCPDNKWFCDKFEEWCKYSNNIIVWYYPMEAYFYAGSTVYLFNTYDDYKYLKEHNVYGVFICGESAPFDSAMINYTLQQQLMWDTDLTYEEYIELMKEDMYLMYGDAYEYMYEYLVIMNEAHDRAPGSDGNGHYCGFHSAPMKKLDMTYIKENADEILELYNKAMEVSTKKNKKTVDKFFLHARYLIAGATHTSRWLNGTEEQRKAYKENLDYFVAHSKGYGVPICSDEDGFTLYYVDPNKEIDYDENPFYWMVQHLSPNFYGFGGFSEDFNY